MPKLTQPEVDTALQTLSGWSQTGEEIQKQFQFADFKQAMEFVNRVADAAEAADHHPDIDIRYNKVKIALSTHSEGGITQKDIDLARQIEG
ncbi:MAG: 4a-hydroxytetrahydrobiopterin dehydratase [Abitibacteriaceae bacterium]|nr:4a-hydroxytetrahydrobiopterin dehydratase [Abditibacteriaceae bacterium]MBV9866068.1 4a-hydroxytetrahydrobiopterin dehydratase [Abditibacteriaceae bacterium]